MKRTIQFLFSILLLIVMAGCPDEETRKKVASYDPVKEQQEWSLASEQIEKNNPAGLLKLWEIATESISAENSEVTSEEVRGYLYSKPGLWIKAFSTLEFSKFKKDFESIDFDIYRFTPDGELPETVAAKKIVTDLKKMNTANKW